MSFSDNPGVIQILRESLGKKRIDLDELMSEFCIVYDVFESVDCDQYQLVKWSVYDFVCEYRQMISTLERDIRNLERIVDKDDGKQVLDIDAAREYPCDRIFEDAGSVVRRRGRQWQTSCILHEDRNPSCYVDPEKNLWHCFSCGQGGDSIALVMKHQSLPFKEAVLYLS